MKARLTFTTTLLLAVLMAAGLLPAAMNTTAAETTLRGVVMDDAGKPIRGAVVKATAGNNTIARFTNDGGRYEIVGLKAAEHLVSAVAPGFAQETHRRSSAQAGDLNFTLKQRFDLKRLSTSELLTTFPENHETKFLRAQCLGCHTFLPIAQKRGLDASKWQTVVQTMGKSTGYGVRLSPTGLKYAGEVLEKYFGPASKYDAAKVKRASVAAAALNATFYEYRTPTNTRLIHSIVADSSGNGWFTEHDYKSNKFAKLNFATGEITEYPIPTSNAAAHTPVIDTEGLVWCPLADGNKLDVIDPKTGKITEYELPLKEWGMDPNVAQRPHTPALDAEGNVWLTSTRTNWLFKFDRKTKTFERYPVAMPKEIPEDAQVVWSTPPGEKPSAAIAGSYSIEVDSKGLIWYNQLALGTVASFDPKTKETRAYRAPGVVSSRGLAIDRDDNIWFSNWDGHTLVRMDRKTGAFKQYQPPTPYASVYGMVFDKNGNLWYADYMGNNITMFDPRTEQFLEYPIPTENAMPRYISVDDRGRVWFTEWWHSKVGVLIPGTTAPQRTAR